MRWLIFARHPNEHTHRCAVSACGCVSTCIDEYYSEFLANVRDWAARVRIVEPGQARQKEATRVSNLYELYGERVIPAAVVSVLNNGCPLMEHALTAATSAEYVRYLSLIHI